MHISLTYESIINYVQIVVDILCVWFVINFLIKFVRNNQKTIQLFQGVVLIILVEVVAKFLGLTTVSWLANIVVGWGFMAIIVIFQPEIRTMLERLGKSNAFDRISILSSSEKEKLIDELMIAATNLSATKTGALISVEQQSSLSEYVNTGIRMNSDVSAELLCSIFMTTTPLHDGAVIIQGDKLACASAYFPPTTADIPSKYGARHRAAIGISEVTDAFTIVVSEETGRVAVTDNGKLIPMNEVKLREYLNKAILNKESVTAQDKAVKAVKKDSVSVEDIIKSSNNPETEIKETKDSKNNREMKNFMTESFKVSDLKSAEGEKVTTDTIVKNIVSNSIEDTGLSKNVKLKTVSVPKDTIVEPTRKASSNKGGAGNEQEK